MSQRSIFMPEEQKHIVASHNTFSNDVVGVFAFGMGISSLASTNASGLASISFVFCCIWMFYKGILIYPILRRAYQGIPWWQQTIDGLLENMIYLIGLGFVGFVALGLITSETFDTFSLAKMWSSTGN
ncbi:hypothetical protein [Psychromonas aquatilis]|uniref:Uncharacterized protein n=1 Tax=Psychromonas aquatilis TaxID=2005072 RepID=A0ABU9GS66_9GAMM